MNLRSRTGSPQTRLRSQLIVQLVRKDLKVKYQGSTLGFLWSLANPLLLMVVYTFVFAIVFRSRVPFFGLFLLTGMLIWNFFTMGVSGAATSILANAGLVKKVPFAHESLDWIRGCSSIASIHRPHRGIHRGWDDSVEA